MSVNSTPIQPVPVPLEVLGNSEYSQTYRVGGHDHTLGNPIRHLLVSSQSNDVDFAGYSVPHPSERVVQIRVQMKTDKGRKADEAIVDACDTLKELCQHIKTKVEQAHDNVVKVE